MPNSKFDSLIVNANPSSSAESILSAFHKSKEHLDKLPPKLKKDKDLVRLKLFQEIGHQESNNSFFRKADQVNTALVNLWLSNVKQLANLFVSINQLSEFKGITKEELAEIATLNVEPRNILLLPQLLADKGIVLVIESSIKGLKTDGVAFKLRSGHPVIGISLRYKRLDMFWFTLMHELSHICLHYDKLDDYIIDDFESKRDNITEQEADKLAGNSLIPRHIWRTCPARKNFNQVEVEAFAKKHNVHPIVVAGRLQKELKAEHILAQYVNNVDVRELIENE
ncbi:ImmA/IrrE family metallo-endopeptidase [Nitrincola sp.]|uniref:ImmA/IrrE family metallo-endopeptidase n=1 Tax=Nitrincola sp. TaxID=1926584 RepID=UPI003A91F846